MKPQPDLICIGAAHWDVIGRVYAPLEPGADVPGRVTRRAGGVALNIAATLARLGLRPAILSAVGCDAEGDELAARIAALGVEGRFLARTPVGTTGRYVAIEAADALVAAVADARGLEMAGRAILAPLGDGQLASDERPWAGPVVIDGNLGADLLAEIAVSPTFRAADLRIASAGSGKAARLRQLLGLENATVYLNLTEASLLAGAPAGDAPSAAAALVALGARRVLVTDGGRTCADASAAGILTAEPPRVRVARVTGAGDTFMAAHILAERQGLDRASALGAALRTAADYIAQGEPQA